jgi:hypothetical protein
MSADVLAVGAVLLCYLGVTFRYESLAAAGLLLAFLAVANMGLGPLFTVW